MKRMIVVFALVCGVASLVYAQRTDLSGLRFCIDPGHGGYNAANDRHLIPDPGTDFWESESNFRKALRLDTLLTARGAWVILTRYTNDYPSDDEPSLTARWTLANANNVNWFHSIHSNATGWTSNTTVNYTLVLVKEDKTTRKAVFPEAVVMGNIIGPSIQSYIRNQSRSTWTYLDYTFYGGPNGGFNLGVLNGLTMPGQLSEGSFHDFFPETRRLMNNSYRKMEAYALRNAFMQYFGVPADTLGIIAGIQTDAVSGRGINFSRVRLLPLNRMHEGDGYYNGFYMFDNLAPGTYTVRFETPGYSADSVQVTVNAGSPSFADRALILQADPTITSASPANSDTTVIVTTPIVLAFSKPMDTVSVQTAFSITPSVPGTIQWSSANAVLTFSPSVYLTPWVTYQVCIDTTARSASGQMLDGNADGVPGDPFVLQFRTKYADVFPPAVTSIGPDTIQMAPAPTPVVNITFDEPLNPTSVNTSNFQIQKVGGSLQAKTIEYAQANGLGGVTMYMPSGLTPGSSYRVRVSRMADLLGNAMPTTASILWVFSIAPGTYSSTLIDAADSGATGLNTPSDPAGASGIDSLTASISTARKWGAVTGNQGSLSLWCRWDTTAVAWMVPVSLDPASGGGQVRFQQTGTILRAYLYGDGSRSQVRFCVADSMAAGAGKAASIEASRWFTIDWAGWRALHWDLETDSVIAVTGNGILDGDLRFEGFQFRYMPGASTPAMQVYLDHIERVERTPVEVAETPASMPESFVLYPAYPNPFNATTSIRYGVGVVSREGVVATEVRLAVYDLLGREVAVLVNESKAPGSYEARWDASQFSSGIYVVRLVVTGGGQFSASEKVILMK